MDEQTVEKHKTIEFSPLISSNDLLAAIYDITRAIFRHLIMLLIDSCSLVCESWSHITRLIKKHRHTIHTLTYSSNLLPSTTNSSSLLSDFYTFISLHL